MLRNEPKPLTFQEFAMQCDINHYINMIQNTKNSSVPSSLPQKKDEPWQKYENRCRRKIAKLMIIGNETIKTFLPDESDREEEAKTLQDRVYNAWKAVNNICKYHDLMLPELIIHKDYKLLYDYVNLLQHILQPKPLQPIIEEPVKASSVQVSAQPAAPASLSVAKASSTIKEKKVYTFRFANTQSGAILPTLFTRKSKRNESKKAEHNPYHKMR